MRACKCVTSGARAVAGDGGLFIGVLSRVGMVQISDSPQQDAVHLPKLSSWIETCLNARSPQSPYLGARASRPHAGEMPALPDSPTALFSRRAWGSDPQRLLGLYLGRVIRRPFRHQRRHDVTARHNDCKILLCAEDGREEAGGGGDKNPLTACGPQQDQAGEEQGDHRGAAHLEAQHRPNQKREEWGGRHRTRAGVRNKKAPADEQEAQD